jgi:hypothetical protein
LRRVRVVFAAENLQRDMVWHQSARGRLDPRAAVRAAVRRSLSQFSWKLVIEGT